MPAERFGSAVSKISDRGHEDERAQAPVVVLHGSPQPVDPAITVGIVAHGRPPFDATGHRGVNCARKLKTKGAGHGYHVTIVDEST